MEAKTSPRLTGTAFEAVCDGGVPGDSLTERVLRTLPALLSFRPQENIQRSGVFKKHSLRLLSFIQGLDLNQISQTLRDLCDESMDLLERPDFEWDHWSDAAEKLVSSVQRN